ncbi:hypothetical protein POTOM_058623 [Populus tomentosa]|uniref:Bulb-type lectin domain-containing protein n=1 Tax=Populus tomentosa TaxID=118781 RepID=A0A8X7XRN9_POPTO|nr:hypothetical protein POTOM_058623 [Populus tomentosa]
MVQTISSDKSSQLHDPSFPMLFSSLCDLLKTLHFEIPTLSFKGSMENPKPFKKGTDTGLAYNPIFGRSKDISLISICPSQRLSMVKEEQEDISPPVWSQAKPVITELYPSFPQTRQNLIELAISSDLTLTLCIMKLAVQATVLGCARPGITRHLPLLHSGMKWEILLFLLEKDLNLDSSLHMGEMMHGKRYLGIWYCRYSPRTVVWVANRENPLDNSRGVFSLGQDGNLQVMDGNRTSYWSARIESTSSSSSFTRRLKLMDSGNLVLIQEAANGHI